MSAPRHLVFFDLDGTLEDSRRDMSDSINRVRAEFGLPPLPTAHAVTFVNKGMDYLYLNAFPELTTPAGQGPQLVQTIERIRAAYVEDYGRHIADHTRAYEGIPEAVKALSVEGILSVYTNKPEALSRLLLQKLGLMENLKGVIGCDTYPETKPSPEPLRRMRDQLNFPAGGKIVMVGDTAGDMKAARSAGIHAVFAAWGYDSALPDPAPDAVAHNPSDLPQIIAEL